MSADGSVKPSNLWQSVLFFLGPARLSFHSLEDPHEAVPLVPWYLSTYVLLCSPHSSGPLSLCFPALSLALTTIA